MTSEMTIAAAIRQRLRRTRLMGAFHFINARTRDAGAATIVNGHSRRDNSGTISAMESYKLIPVSSFAARAFPAPAAIHEGHQVSSPKETEHNRHRNRPHCEHAATARLAG